MKIAITTDSSSGILPDEAKQLGIAVIPIPVLIEGDCYFEGVDLSVKQLYAALGEGKRVSTSQPAPFSVQKCWKNLIHEGYEHIIHIPIAKELSSSYDTALTAARGMDGRVTVVNNHRLSIPLREAALHAKRMADEGSDVKQIVNRLESFGTCYGIFITVNTLDYLGRSGRIGRVAASVGNMLNIKPVVEIEEGSLAVIARPRGFHKAISEMFERLKILYDKEFSALDTKIMTLGVAGTALDQAIIDELQERLLQEYPCKKIYYNELPACVGCHIGPGAVGIGFCFD